MPNLPTSVLFDVFDWGPVGVGVARVGDDNDGMLAFAETSRGFPFARSDFVGDDDRLEIYSDDGETTELKFQYNIVNSYTLETEVRFPGLALPSFGEGLQDPNDKHIFIAAADKQDNAAGILFTKEGISIVAYPDNVTVPITDTASLIPADGDELITVRIAVDGEKNLVDLYVTKSTDLAADKPHNLVATLRASQSLGLNFDGAYISVKGVAEDPCRVVLRSFRLARRVVAPHARPIANAGRNVFYPLSGSVQLDGSLSSDPDGGILTYKWTISSSPAGSSPTITGSVKAVKAITNAAETDGFTLTAVKGGQAGNTISITMSAAEAADGTLTLSATGTAITITLASDAGNAISSRYGDVFEALTNQNNPSYSVDVAALVTATRAGFGNAEGFVEALPQALLAGGEDSTIADPVFRTDTLGTYQMDLITNNGFLDSISASILVVAHETMQPLGYIPDASYIWNSLPDFWKLVPDKDPFATYWSTAVQAISGEMLKAWQTDYSKALIDVPRKFVRKWLSFDPFLEDAERVVYKVQTFRAGTRQEKKEAVRLDKPWLHVPGRSPGVVRVAAVPNASISTLSGTSGVSMAKDFKPFALNTDTFTDTDISVESYSNIAPRTQHEGVSYSGDLLVNTGTGDAYEIKDVGSANKKLVLVTDNLPIYTVIDSGTSNGKVVDDGDDDLDSNLWGLSYGRLKTSAIQVDDKLWVTRAGGTQESYNVTGFNLELGAVTLNQELRISEYTGLAWKVVRRTEQFSWKIAPHIESDLDLVNDEMVKKGDLVRFRVSTTVVPPGGVTTTTTTTVQSEVSAVLDSYWDAISGRDAPRSKVVFDPGTAASGDTAGTGLLGTIGSFDLSSIAEDLTETTHKLEYLGILRLSSLPLDKTVTSIPNLRHPVVSPTSEVADTNSLKENLHYNVLAPSGSSAYGSVAFKSVFSSTVLPPDKLWAELVYFNNNETIEANFGGLAGYTAEEVVDNGLDYLSAVQALWYAYFGGPSVSNMRLGCQALFGLPFTEKAGTVVSVDPEYSFTEGRIVIQDEDDENVKRSYTYPLSVGTEVVATQDTVYNTTLKRAVGSGAASIAVVSTEGFEPGQKLTIGPPGSLEIHKIRGIDHTTGEITLSMQVVGDYQPTELIEARTEGAATELDAFTPLSKGVTIEDYINAPRWWVYRVHQGLLTEVEKYFTFKVTLEGSLASSTENFDMVVKFIKQIKPAYTTPLFSAGLFFDDQVSLSDQMYSLPVRLFLYDNPRGGPDITFGANAEASRTETLGHPTAVMFDGYDGKGSIVTSLDRAADPAVPYGQRIPYAGGQSQSDMDIRADRASPRYHFTINAGGDPKLFLDTAVTVPDEYFAAKFNASEADGIPISYYVVVQGTIQDDGVYKINAAVDSVLMDPAQASYITLKTLADQDPTPLAHDQGSFYLIDDNSSATQTVTYDAGTGKWTETVASKGRMFDPGVNEPKAMMDNNPVPFYRTVNQRIKVDLDYDVINMKKQGEDGYDEDNAQSGPRMDQGLIVDDFLSMDVGKLARVPNMHNTAIPPSGGNGLFWWVDDEGFYTNYTIAGGLYVPAGSIVSTGYVERVVGHKGLSLPPKDPNIFIDASPRSQSVNE